ncbi:hypothetical protein STXM2123_5281 [Streptomyces sp. F-3]|jgi:hypothetical protein|uniref:Response regulator n=1 Tax=Streptomyces thermogriseus TaxID=75292 RepID=A0ABN1T4U7_9ACTN|nr:MULTISPECIES: hypothetical protein [Streptomyces]MDN5382036.1 hypothetical protein [Streptomyces sp. LB8]GAT84577.1 hypothetical protein STXM2123_5281 [Streptomyces sp. F-3]
MIHALVVDDAELVREALRRILAAEAERIRDVPAPPTPPAASTAPGKLRKKGSAFTPGNPEAPPVT